MHRNDKNIILTIVTKNIFMIIILLTIIIQNFILIPIMITVVIMTMIIVIPILLNLVGILFYCYEQFHCNCLSVCRCTDLHQCVYGNLRRFPFFYTVATRNGVPIM